MKDRTPKLRATLTFGEGALEELIAQQISDSGYVLEALSWDEGVATASVRPMTLEERADAGIQTESAADLIAAQVRQALMETHSEYSDAVSALRDEVLDQYRLLNARLEGLQATVTANPRTAVVQERPTPRAEMSVADAGQATFDTSDMTLRQIKDRKAYEARLAEIRQEQGEGNRHPQMPDANKHVRGEHEFDDFHDALNAALEAGDL